jgi:hypothetical protein
MIKEVLAKSRVCHPERREGFRFFGRKLPQNDKNLEAFARGSKVNPFFALSNNYQYFS